MKLGRGEIEIGQRRGPVRPRSEHRAGQHGRRLSITQTLHTRTLSHQTSYAAAARRPAQKKGHGDVENPRLAPSLR